MQEITSPTASLATLDDDLPPYPTPDDDSDTPDAILSTTDSEEGRESGESGEETAEVVTEVETEAMAEAREFVEGIDAPALVPATRQDYAEAAGKKRPVMGKKGTGPSITKENPVLPVPPYRTYNSESARRDQRPKDFFAWKDSLPEWVKKSTMLYTYRLHPVLKPVDNGESFNIGKIPGEEEGVTEETFLNRFGCGDYKLIFNASPGGQICVVFMKNVGGGDYKSHPPNDERINDPNNVDFNNPNNKSYEGFLRSTGRHPETLAGREKEMDVATIHILEKVMDRNSELVEKMMEDRQQQPATPPNLDAVAAQKVMDVLVDGSKRAMSMVEASYNQQLQTKEPAAIAQDPMVFMNSMLALMEKMGLTPNKKDDTANGEIKSLMEEVREMRRENNELRNMQLQMLQEELKAIRATPQPGSTTSIVEQFKALREVKDLLTEDDDGVEDAVKGVAGSLAPKWIAPYLPVIETVAGAWFKSMAQQQGMGMGQPQPQQPPQHLPANWQPMPQGQPQLGAAPLPSMPPQMGNPGPVPGPHVVTMPSPQSAPVAASPYPPQVLQFISMIAPGVLSNLTSGKSGIEFTDIFMDYYGQQAYDDLLEYNFGEDAILQAMLAHPGLGPQLVQFPQDRVKTFVHEFVNYYKITEKDAGDPTGPVPVPNAGGEGGAA